MSKNAYTVEYTDVSGDRRRVEFEPRAGDLGHLRIESVYERGRGTWREVGREIVCDVAIDGAQVVA
ncbi:hypothetical protein C2R22_05795 [Salinigranum rubrum]|uniref:Uncharacterized protein n=1 Tax=Salinigranum rubrum TaxID=755307 RepID=A0A2I8VH39_9EURY|nr:hypothetical protein [Salinigranum rubrum]AUV81230.1 hypothetical protein C2R22_05795 [Salinigranum rubrum]